MNLLVQFGIGLLTQAVAAQQTRQFQNQMAQNTQQFTAQYEPQFDAQQKELAAYTYGSRYQLDDEAPPFPEEAANRLAMMQTNNSQQMESLSNAFLDKYAAMKDETLADNHLDTGDGPDGQPQVALNQQGQPTLSPGKETPQQATARQTYEDSTKSQLADKHGEQNKQFVQDQKEKVMTFLDQNKTDLNNPAVQSQLHQLLTDTHKKALKLTADQERETLKADAYTPEMAAAVDQHCNARQQMQEEHSQMEENSDEATQLYNHQQDLAELLRQRKDEANQAAQEEMFLKGPPSFAADQKTDVGKVLPPYLADALNGLGIYEI
ncbi:MAG: hypothetical protein ACYCW6_00980 [Candidatus Xenobia bacterium]